MALILPMNSKKRPETAKRPKQQKGRGSPGLPAVPVTGSGTAVVARRAPAKAVGGVIIRA
jgi:hypothetical protein